MVGNIPRYEGPHRPLLEMGRIVPVQTRVQNLRFSQHKDRLDLKIWALINATRQPPSLFLYGAMAVGPSITISITVTKLPYTCTQKYELVLFLSKFSVHQQPLLCTKDGPIFKASLPRYASALSGVPFKSYNTTSTKRSINTGTRGEGRPPNVGSQTWCIRQRYYNII